VEETLKAAKRQALAGLTLRDLILQIETHGGTSGDLAEAPVAG